jgi:hypothetical protein
MDVDWDPDSDLRFYHVWIQDPAAFGHICDRLAEAISARSAAFLQNDPTARSVPRELAVTVDSDAAWAADV